MSNRQHDIPDRLLPQHPNAEMRRTHFIQRGREDAVTVIGRRSGGWRDLYYQAMRLSWPRFMAAGIALFLSLNIVFALLYSLQPDGISEMSPGSFAQAFFFSVQTLATIGYGRWAPISTYANLVVTAESFLGISMIALFTALAFARFARPSAKIVFSRCLVVTRFDGADMLMLRLANERGNQILEARVSLSVLLDEWTVEGHYFRRLHDLKLARDHTPVLGMTFQVMHKIDESSPLFGFTPDRMVAEWVDIVALVSGLDETSMQTVHARASYDGTEIKFGHRFADLFGFLPDGKRAIDYRQFNVTEPDGLP
jgi:inward rectifier potassium channel